MKSFILFSITYIVALFISFAVVNSTYGNGEHMAIFTLCLSCAVFLALLLIAVGYEEQSFLTSLSRLFCVAVLSVFVVGVLCKIPALFVMATLAAVVVSTIKGLYNELKTA